MRIIGIGGTQRDGSGSELAMRIALEAARTLGADVECFAGPRIELPMYNPAAPDRTSAATELIEAVRSADGVILASPGYHGTVSGLVKNALDYVEDTVTDARPYFDALPVGCIGVARGWQAAGNTLRTLRDIVHALRGVPTPYGAAISTAQPVFDRGICIDDGVRRNLSLLGTQVAEMADLLSRKAAVA
ncbi:MAG TPA: NAD(P)H-dependent oxidoreductase [Jatrophihabitans sp.]